MKQELELPCKHAEGKTHRIATSLCLLIVAACARGQQDFLSSFEKSELVLSAPSCSLPGSGGLRARSPADRTDRLAAYPELYGWVMWWSANREEFLKPSGIGFGATSRPINDGLRRLSSEEIRAGVIPVLNEGLKDEEREIRRSAALSLGLCGEEREVATLSRMLADRDRGVREAAIVGLGLLGQRAADTILAGILNNPDLNARERGLAALALGLSGGEGAQKPLTDGLGRGSTPSVEACRVLGAALWAGSDTDVGRRDRSANVASLIQGVVSSPEIKDRALLGIGAAALSKTRDPGSAEFMMKALSDRRRELRVGAAIAAGRVIRSQDAGAVEALVKAFRGEAHLLTRRLMLISFGRIGGTECRKLLREELSAKERHHRSFAALGLGIAGATESAQLLHEELRRGGDERVQGACMIALAIMRDPEVFDVVAAMTKTHLTDELRTHFMWFLAVAKDPKGVPLIRGMLRSTQEAEYQELGAIALGIIGSPDAQALLIEMLQGKGPITTKAAGAAGLARMGDWRALDPLRKAIASQDESSAVRAAAIAALGVLAQRQPFLPFPRVAIDSFYDGILNEPIDELSRMAGTGRLNAEHRGNRGF